MYLDLIHLLNIKQMIYLICIIKEILLNPVAPEEEGKRRLKKIQWILDNIKLRNGTKLVRNANQKAWHKWCIAAVLPKIYGDSWERLAPEVLKEWGKSHILPIYNII